jgi:hypothetical protein
VGGEPLLYQFFRKQPNDIRIASLTEEANHLPTFARRSVLVAKTYADPYHVGYYRQIRQRANDLIRAQYSQDLAQVQNINRKYKIDFWLLERTGFTPEYIANNNWLQQYQPTATEAVNSLKLGNIPALSKLTKACSVFEQIDCPESKLYCQSIKKSNRTQITPNCFYEPPRTPRAPRKVTEIYTNDLRVL